MESEISWIQCVECHVRAENYKRPLRNTVKMLESVGLSPITLIRMIHAGTGVRAWEITRNRKLRTVKVPGTEISAYRRLA
jgi:hypothetical protein